jgi:hypothetical protein
MRVEEFLATMMISILLGQNKNCFNGFWQKGAESSYALESITAVKCFTARV